MKHDLSQEEAVAIFHKYDNTYAVSIDDDKVHERFITFYEKIKDLTQKDLSYETGDLIQDANFHSSFQIDSEGNDLVFSRYGNLVSIYKDEEVEPSLLDAIRELASTEGYTYIPSKFTRLVYNGSEMNATDWWERYFSW